MGAEQHPFYFTSTNSDRANALVTFQKSRDGHVPLRCVEIEIYLKSYLKSLSGTYAGF